MVCTGTWLLIKMLSIMYTRKNIVWRNSSNDRKPFYSIKQCLLSLPLFTQSNLFIQAGVKIVNSGINISFVLALPGSSALGDLHDVEEICV